jgi:hypothetical protein
MDTKIHSQYKTLLMLFCFIKQQIISGSVGTNLFNHFLQSMYGYVLIILLCIIGFASDGLIS